MVACVTSNGGIGKDSDFIVKTDEYLQWLVEEVKGTVVVVGRKTYEKGILPEEIYENEHYIFNENIEEELREVAKQGKNISILGGERVFYEFIEYVDVIKCAELDGYYKADKFFPDFDLDMFGVEFLGELEKKHGKGVIKAYYKKTDK